MVRTCAALLAIVQLNAVPGSGRSTIGEPTSSLRSRAARANPLDVDISASMGEALGCGGQAQEQQLAAIEKGILPIYRALPKNGHGRIGRRSLQFLAYRHFMGRSSLLIRGFEPSRPTNSSAWGGADILSQRVPAYVEAALQSEHAEQWGFGLRDAVQLVVTLEQLVLDSESALLEVVYADLGRPLGSPLVEESLGMLLETYMVYWMVGEHAEIRDALMSNRTLFEQAFPHWGDIAGLVRGHIKSLRFQRERAPRAAARPGRGALSPLFSFEDAHALVGQITGSFASFWASECAGMKESLAAMDVHRTGRVPLSRFYHAGLGSDWRFGESEAYLRELGALDETSWRGKQVLIPNYVQAASNCIVTTPYYMVCCSNDCELHLGEIEASVGAPTAAPAQILGLVGNMTATLTLDDDEAPRLEGALEQQLGQIAALHGGQVPLHGRLFQMWLHYVFPRDCPYPHRAGSTSAATPLEFGSDHIATEAAMHEHARNAGAPDAQAAPDGEGPRWPAQWSYEEELLSEDAAMRAPWEYSYRTTMAGSLAILGLLVLAALWLAEPRPRHHAAGGLLPTHTKAHFV